MESRIVATKSVSTGRGEAGKSTFVAPVSRYLKPATLLVDLDPDLLLVDMLGLDFHEEKKRTVCDPLYVIIERRKSKMSPPLPRTVKWNLSYGAIAYTKKEVLTSPP
ncbi:MAG: hypothetical protein R6U93_08145 [Dehalococcoidia bacterium]|jgi:CO dehydrogenase nickel-insertion accessory protein CooC1